MGELKKGGGLPLFCSWTYAFAVASWKYIEEQRSWWSAQGESGCDGGFMRTCEWVSWRAGFELKEVVIP